MRIPFLIVSMSLLAGCTVGLKPQGTPLRPESVGKILFRVAPENLDETQTAGMAERISSNLRSWGYPVETERTQDIETEVTHEMLARVGSIEHKGTPTGFSFSIGNSDPRALGFQKADVLPVTCTLKSTAHSSETVSLFMDFIADKKIKDPGRARNDPASLNIFENHIGTVCFNLLDKLKVPRKKPVSADAASTWMPEIRIEVTEKPAKAESRSSTGALPVRPVGTDRHTILETPISEDHSSSPPEEPPVVTETGSDTQEDRKRIIIHNRGNPVILDFGFERK
ncbi:hypothetical protein [Methylocaldum szegediense]|uniref:Lipoprotein n=1 Tax=Methylocaldum szegediense TaxID=73780 RepID=A0ABN8X941_9GAMM|nr:hypothetical protein [Methylocaldum szegediense]CAI8915101.1 conserved protein of unknown function [Methylocaldum szegediense]